MDLQPYVDAVRHELNLAAAAAGETAQDLADRLSAPLESALRLALLEALSAAAEEITGELAPRSVDVRLRGRDPEFIVSAPLDERVAEDFENDAKVFDAEYDDGGTWRVTLRLPEGLRSAVEAAARREGASLNAWLVRAAAAASHGAGQAGAQRSTRHGGQHVTGWVR
ncbi:histidine kinase [Mycobacterium sp.]|uniref:histidine kinase n=1 Tax=Mycobacterium sp. TaxID=1785 RepID=UPI003C766D36